MDLRKTLLILSLCLAARLVEAQQPISLNDCYQRALSNHPIGIQASDLQKINQLNQQILNPGWLPQLTLNAQATYQSEVIDIGISLPGISLPSPARDQYRITLDVQQTIYEGGMTRRQIELAETRNKIEQQELEVQKYPVLEQVNRHFFQHFTLLENLNILQLTIGEIEQRLAVVEAAIAHGAQSPAAAWALKAELLKLDQTKKELLWGVESNIKILEILTGEEIGSEQLKLPGDRILVFKSLKRPELSFFDLQKQSLQSAARLASIARFPRVSAFAQGGYGRPGFNLLSDEFDFFYIAGIRLNWNIWDWQKTRNERQMQLIRSDMVDSRRLFFEQNINTAITAVQSQIGQLEQALDADAEIISIQEKIVASAGSQLQNGVINPAEYLHYVNALAQARISHEQKRIKLLQAIAEYNIITGNY